MEVHEESKAHKMFEYSEKITVILSAGLGFTLFLLLGLLFLYGRSSRYGDERSKPEMHASIRASKRVADDDDDDDEAVEQDNGGVMELGMRYGDGPLPPEGPVHPKPSILAPSFSSKFSPGKGEVKSDMTML